MPTGWRPADVAARYPLSKPDLNQFRKFDVPLSLAQQLYVGIQFALYTLLGSYLLSNGDVLPWPALLVGWAWVALGLFVFGATLENRPAALKLEGLRLVVNLPLMASAPVVGLWPVTSTGWAVLLAYTALSAIAVYCARGRFTRLAGS
jgi:fucose permease